GRVPQDRTHVRAPRRRRAGPRSLRPRPRGLSQERRGGRGARALTPYEAKTKDRDPVGDRALLARAARAVGVLGEARALRRVARRSERGRLEDERLVLRRALLHVGLNEELAARLEEARDLDEERVAHDEALLVTLLPPRIRKVQERALERAVGPEAREGE